MATHEIPILGSNTAPDTTGNCYQVPLEVAATFGTATYGQTLCWVMLGNLASDMGVYGSFAIPQNYAGTPVIVVRGIIEDVGAFNLGFGCSYTDGIAHDEAANVAYTTTTEVSAADPDTALDMYEETISMTGVTYTAGDMVFYYFYREGTNDTSTHDFMMTDLSFRYSDT